MELKQTFVLLTFGISVLLIGNACGKPSTTEPLAAAPPLPAPTETPAPPVEQPAVIDPNEIVIPVNQKAAFGAQCPTGSVRDPSPAELTFNRCATPLEKLELKDAPPSLLLSADCVQKMITIRDLSGRKLDASYFVRPNGTEVVKLDGEPLTIANDGAGHVNCQTPTTLEIEFKLDCPSDPKLIDKAKIEVQVFWNLGDYGEHPISLGNACKFPKVGTGCYMHAAKTIPQCG